KRVLSDPAVGGDVVRTNVIEFIDLFARNELINLDSARALQRNCFEFFVGDLDVLSLPYLVTTYDLVGRYLIARAIIYPTIPDAVARFAVDLMEADFLAFARRWEERNWTGYKRKAQIAFPVRSRRHDTFLATISTPLLLKPFRYVDQARSA